MTAAGWLRQIGLALGRRDAAGGRCVRASAASSARATAGGSIASIQADTLPVLRAPMLITRLDAGGLSLAFEKRLDNHSCEEQTDFVN